MPELKIDTPKDQVISRTTPYETAMCKDEINLIDYLQVLWRWKFFILLGSVLPAMVIGLIFFLKPRKFKVTYIYDVKAQSGCDISNWNLNQNEYKILLSRFYSDENRNKIKAKLPKYNSEAVNFEVWPSYTNLSETKISDVTMLKQVEQASAQLLNMTITGTAKNSISEIASVIRDNFENIMPVYTVKDQLNAATRRLRAQIATIEENRADLELALITDKAILTKLKNIKTKTSATRENNITLQFDIGGKTEYLPVEYQIQATESKTVQFEEQIVSDEKMYNRYKDLLTLNEKLLAELEGKMFSHYTIQQFHFFLIDLIDSYENKKLKDYLNSYIKKIENRVSKRHPIIERPKVHIVPRSTVTKTTIVFIAVLAVTTFAAFLLETAQKN